MITKYQSECFPPKLLLAYSCSADNKKETCATETLHDAPPLRDAYRELGAEGRMERMTLHAGLEPGPAVCRLARLVSSRLDSTRGLRARYITALVAPPCPTCITRACPSVCLHIATPVRLPRAPYCHSAGSSPVRPPEAGIIDHERIDSPVILLA